MSLFAFNSSAFSIKPHVSIANGILESYSAKRFLILSLGTFHKRVTIDPKKEKVVIKKRILYFFQRTREVQFSQVKRVDYDCSSIPTSFSLFHGTNDEIDSFSVGLILKNGTEVLLWRFIGEGAVYTGWRGVLLGDDMVEFHGDQDDASRDFANMVCALLDRKLT